MKILNYKTRLDEVGTVSNKIVLYFNDVESLQDEEFLSLIMPEITELTQNLTTAYNREKIKSEFEDADAVRDEAVRTLGSLIDAYAVIPNEAMQTAANALKTIFDRYGKKIASSSYGKETLEINSLLEELADESLAESIAALGGVSDAIEAIRTAQTAFDELDVAYANAISNKGETAYSYRKPLLKAINEKLVPFLTLAVDLLPDKYAPFATNVEQAIDNMNTTVTKRSKSSSETTETTETTE